MSGALVKRMDAVKGADLRVAHSGGIRYDGKIAFVRRQAHAIDVFKFCARASRVRLNYAPARHAGEMRRRHVRLRHGARRPKIYSNR